MEENPGPGETKHKSLDYASLVAKIKIKATSLLNPDLEDNQLLITMDEDNISEGMGKEKQETGYIKLGGLKPQKAKDDGLAKKVQVAEGKLAAPHSAKDEAQNSFNESRGDKLLPEETKAETSNEIEVIPVNTENIDMTEVADKASLSGRMPEEEDDTRNTMTNRKLGSSEEGPQGSDNTMTTAQLLV